MLTWKKRKKCTWSHEKNWKQTTNFVEMLKATMFIEAIDVCRFYNIYRCEEQERRQIRIEY